MLTQRELEMVEVLKKIVPCFENMRRLIYKKGIPIGDHFYLSEEVKLLDQAENILKEIDKIMEDK